MQILKTTATVTCALVLLALNLYEAFEFAQQLMAYSNGERQLCDALQPALQPSMQDIAGFVLERGARRLC